MRATADHEVGGRYPAKWKDWKASITAPIRPLHPLCKSCGKGRKIGGKAVEMLCTACGQLSGIQGEDHGFRRHTGAARRPNDTKPGKRKACRALSIDRREGGNQKGYAYLSL
jgi:hypothetical protein